MSPKVLVLGAGVSGLSTAQRLLSSGAQVTLWAREDPLATTSAVAAALWYPFEAGPPARVDDWARRSYRTFLEFAERAVPGVVIEPLLDLRSPAIELPGWVSELEGFRFVSELPAGFEQGWEARVPVVETPLYLSWLADEVRARGATLVQRQVHDFAETRGFDVVVNCTGLGARALCGDRACFPIRGQIARVERAGLSRALIFHHADGTFGYVIPRSRDCVLGGTAERDNASLEVDPETTRAILARCRAREPRLASTVTSAAAGLRPGRAEVRLEAETLSDGRRVVHNYGHGGCGVTLSWACAEDASALALERRHAS
jgi:D-amino-acid oxidase